MSAATTGRRTSNVENVFLFSIAAMVSVASLIMSQAEGSLFPTALTPIVAIVALFVVDRKKLIRLNVLTANILGVIAFIVVAFEFSGGTPLTKLIAGAHLLVYMTWIVLLLRKGIRQFWWLCALSVLQVSVASVLTMKAGFGAALAVMLLVMVWTTSVFSMYRAQRRLSRELEGVEDSLDTETVTAERPDVLLVRNGLQQDPSDSWLGWRFRGVVSFTFLASLVVAVITFFIFPRVWMPGTELEGLNAELAGMAGNQTGFTDEVQLGDIGQIMQSDVRVLQFKIARIADRSPVDPEVFTSEMKMDELLFRGTSLGIYNDGKWKLQDEQAREPGVEYDFEQANADFEVRIKQDPPIRVYAFAPLPVSRILHTTPGAGIFQRRNSLVLKHVYRTDFENRQQESHLRQLPAEYIAWCQKPLPGQTVHQPRKLTPTIPQGRTFPQIGGNQVNSSGTGRVERHNARLDNEHQFFARRGALTPDVRSTLPQLTRIADEVCSGSEAERDKAQKLFAYLNTSGTYGYTMALSVFDKSIDPVEDFLLNTQEGHCEYFASAYALMLQTQGIPARVVNGYKGYDTNDVSGAFEVKQRHAHSWVEVFLDNQWETFDPTPAAGRSAVAGSTGFWSDLKRAFTDNWYQAVQRMDLAKQEEMIRPITSRLKNIWKNLKEEGLWTSLKRFWDEVLSKPEMWFSPRILFGTFFVLLALGLTMKANPFAVAWRKLALTFGLLKTSARRERSIVKFYENFKAACERQGFPVPANRTALEVASAATNHFSDRLPSNEDRQLAKRIASTFNRVRFGGRELQAEVVSAIRKDVARFTRLVSAK